MHRGVNFNWAALNLGTTKLEGINSPFIEDKFRAAIDHFALPQGPGAAWVHGGVLKSYWPIVLDVL